MRSLACKSCGWVHFGVTRQYAIQETVNFANYYNALPRQQQMDYYGGRQISLIRAYARCNGCGKPNTNMRNATADEIRRVEGCTISGVIVPEEKVV